MWQYVAHNFHIIAVITFIVPRYHYVVTTHFVWSALCCNCGVTVHVSYYFDLQINFTVFHSHTCNQSILY